MCFYLQVLRLLKLHLIFVLILPLTLFSAWIFPKPVSSALLDETIRIAIAKSVAEVTVNGEGLLITGDSGEPVVLSLPVTVRVFRDGMIADGKMFRKLVFSPTSSVYVNNKPYRGLAELTRFENGILVVNQLALEDYLVGLINCEISSAWPIEAVKAQAVIARSYALSKKAARLNASYHLESSVIDQVYDGCLIEDSRAKRAVTETEQEVLTYAGDIIQAFYHSSCGGKTEASENVWGAPLPYLKGADCQYCQTSQNAAAWDVKLTLAEIEGRLKSSGYKVSGLNGIKAGGLNSRGRNKSVIISAARGGLSLTGDQFRKAVGYGVIKSTRFTVKVVNGEASFSGTGNGHGVGLCQWGAKQRALDGFSYDEILKYYYPGTELKKMSGAR